MVLAKPPAVVRLICGKNAARAASTLAWALARLASAWATSGLRCSNAEGMPGVTVGTLTASRFLAVTLKSFWRLSKQDGEREKSLAFLLAQRRQRSFLACNRRLLLREIKLRRHAIGHLRLGDRQNALGSIDVLLNCRDFFPECENVEIGGGNGRRGGQRHLLLGEPGRFECLIRRAQIVLRQAPDVGLVAGA